MTAGKTTISRPRATIFLNRLAANYRRIVDELNGVPAAGVVKADGYGIGAVAAASTLWAAGCRRFFVARVDEGITLRAALPEAEINVFDGLIPGTTDAMIEHRLVPILNSLDQLEGWSGAAGQNGRTLPAGVHLDTGMRRLGLATYELERLLAEPHRFDGIEIRHILSHLASADISGDPLSQDQLAQFNKIRAELPQGTASLANSAGIFLGPEYHFELARPGISLYGGSPFPDSGRPNPMHSVVTIEAPIIQVRRAEAGESVGYGATYRVGDRSGYPVGSEAKIATVPVGYADGFLRSSSNVGLAAIDGHPVPIVGRVSMDLITVDVSGIDDHLLHPGRPVELLGPNCPVDDVANRAESIPHEFLTNLSRRFELRYEADTAHHDDG